MKAVIRNSVELVPFQTSLTITSKDFWRFGRDNLMPYALSSLARSVPAHRRVINDKKKYIIGSGFTCDDKNKDLWAFIERANKDESLSKVMSKTVLDYIIGGNGYLELVTNRKRSFIALFHQDWTKCRLSHDKDKIILSHDWAYHTKSKDREIPLYPLWKEEDGYYRSIVHFKDYEPMFENYGMPQYIAGLGVSAIAYKTDKWNISRLDNSFQLSGVMELDADENSEEEIKQMKSDIEKKFSGKPGQVLFIVKNKVEDKRGSRFTSMSSTNEGDWKELHAMSNNDIIISHQWFRELSGFDYSSGFSADRILHAYQIAMNTQISDIQNMFIEKISDILQSVVKIDCETLGIVNKPPVILRPPYMKVWEARKADGLDYDMEDPLQNVYISQLNVNNAK